MCHIHTHEAEIIQISVEYFFSKSHDSLKNLNLPCKSTCQEEKGSVKQQTHLRFHHSKPAPNSNLTGKILDFAELKAIVEYCKKVLIWQIKYVNSLSGMISWIAFSNEVQ